MEMAQQMVASAVTLFRTSVITLWTGQPVRKERHYWQCKSIAVSLLATFGSFALQIRRDEMEN
jgi:hypothetical protein